MVLVDSEGGPQIIVWREKELTMEEVSGAVGWELGEAEDLTVLVFLIPLPVALRKL